MSEIAQIPAAGLAVVAMTTALTLGGCASTLSGVGGAENYACKAPVGAQCTSVSGVYANAAHSLSELPRPSKQPAAPIVMSRSYDANPPTPVLAGSQAFTHPGPADHGGKMPQAAAPTGAASTPTATISASTATVAAAAPTLRTDPRVLRLWIAPWEDGDGDLHDGSFVHVVVDTGRWLIDRVHPAARSRLDVATPPLTPPTISAVPTSEANPSSPRGASPLSLGSAPDSSSAER
jgi:conjugal transfer pilus assembly protein TraV